MVSLEQQKKPLEIEETTQRKLWGDLKNTITFHVQNVNRSNIKQVVVKLFKCNIDRGRGLFARAVMKAQMENVKDTSSLYASLVAVLNSKLPKIGKLLCSRLLLQFKLAYMKNNWRVCHSSLVFICHLVLQEVMSEIILLQIIQLLLEHHTAGDIELIAEVFKISGSFLNKDSNIATNMILGRLNDLLQEDEGLSHKSRSTINYVLRLGQRQFKGTGIVDNTLDLVEDDDKETHEILIDSKLKSRDHLDLFYVDPDFAKNEADYQRQLVDILDESNEFEEEQEQEQDQGQDQESGEKRHSRQYKSPLELAKDVKQGVKVVDMSQSEILEFQKRVYLTVMSSMSADEAVHKLLRLKKSYSNSQQNHMVNEKFLADMIIKCCSQEKSYSKFFGIIGEKLCSRDGQWHNKFVDLFKAYYLEIDKFETNSLRNIGKFFGHLFASDVIALEQAWNEIKITEEDTNPPRRILLKFIFQEMVEEMGIKEMQRRLIFDLHVKRHINGVFPVVGVSWKDADDIRFSINFFTAIGLGVLTEEMREVLNNLPEERGRSMSRNRDGDKNRNSSDGSNGYSRSGSSSYSRSRSNSSTRSFSRSRSGSPTGLNPTNAEKVAESTGDIINKLT